MTAAPKCSELALTADAAVIAGAAPCSAVTMCERDMDYFYGHGRIEYNTPQWLFDALNVEFGFTVDAAAAKDNAKCKRYWSAEDDGLAGCATTGSAATGLVVMGVTVTAWPGCACNTMPSCNVGGLTGATGAGIEP